MRKVLSLLLCILSLFILLSCNNKTPEAPETPKHELTGKTITIEIDNSGSREIVFTGNGTLTLTFESDGKTVSWTYVEDSVAKSGTFNNVSVSSANGELKIKAGDSLNLTLSKENTEYKTVGEGKVATVNVPANTSTKILQQEPVTSIEQLKGHTFFGAGNYTAAKIVIDNETIWFYYYTNYNTEGHSLGELKAFAECQISNAIFGDNKMVIPIESYSPEVTTFEIINSSTLRMIDAEKIVLNLIK